MIVAVGTAVAVLVGDRVAVGARVKVGNAEGGLGDSRLLSGVAHAEKIILAMVMMPKLVARFIVFLFNVIHTVLKHSLPGTNEPIAH